MLNPSSLDSIALPPCLISSFITSIFKCSTLSVVLFLSLIHISHGNSAVIYLVDEHLLVFEQVELVGIERLFRCGRAISAHIERKKSKLDFALQTCCLLYTSRCV